MKRIFLISLLAVSSTIYGQSVVLIQKPELPRESKNAILILSGLEDSRKGRKNQVEEFSKLGIDLFIPDYIDRNSIDNTFKNAERFIDEQRLTEYDSLFCLTYIMGSWTLNTIIQKNGFGNIKRIVSDRSPLQERAPRVAKEKVSYLVRLVKGKIVNQLEATPYPTIPNPDTIQIGLIIENKATTFVRVFKKTTLSYGPISMQPEDLNQSFDDLTYTRLNHDQMYTGFDVIGKRVRYFITNGKFPVDARRIPFEFDLFEKYKEPSK